MLKRTRDYRIYEYSFRQNQICRNIKGPYSNRKFVNKNCRGFQKGYRVRFTINEQTEMNTTTIIRCNITS